MIPPHQVRMRGRVVAIEPGPLNFRDLHDLRTHMMRTHARAPQYVIVTARQRHELMYEDPIEMRMAQAHHRGVHGEVGRFEGMTIVVEGARAPLDLRFEDETVAHLVPPERPPQAVRVLDEAEIQRIWENARLNAGLGTIEGVWFHDNEGRGLGYARADPAGDYNITIDPAGTIHGRKLDGSWLDEVKTRKIKTTHEVW